MAAADDELPRALCPRCGMFVIDYDGFGVLAHVSTEEHPDDTACGYCSHPAYEDNRCTICGEKSPSPVVPVYQVTAPHFVAAVEIRDGVVFDAAPIIKYMIGWEAGRFFSYVAEQGWRQELRCKVRDG